MKEHKNTHPQPSKWANSFLEWYCREDLLEDLQGDLYECYDRNLTKMSTRRANLIFIIDVFKFFRVYTFKKIKIKHKMNQLSILKNYFKTSVRSLARNKLFAFINIIGLAISMSVGLIIITLILEIHGFDDFHEKGGQIYRVINTTIDSKDEVRKMATTSMFVSEQLEDYKGYDHKVTMKKGFQGRAQARGKQVILSGLWASNDFFEVFSFPLVTGDPSTALDEPNSILLTETTATKLFGELTAIGQLLVVDDQEYLIKGIVVDPPKNSHFKFEILVSLASLSSESRQDLEWSSSTNMTSYVYLTIPNETRKKAVEGALQLISQLENEKLEQFEISSQLQPLTDIFTDPPLDRPIGASVPAMAAVIFGVLPLIILLTACFNYTNLSLARALRRTIEVGIRKTIGATKRHIFLQFMVESIVIALLAVCVSFLLFLPLRDQFLVMLDGDGVYLPVDGWVILFFVIFAICTGVFASLIPGYSLSKFQAVAALRSHTNVKVFAGLTLRKVLLIAQFSISTILILITIIINKQYSHATSYDLGFSTAKILNVDLQGNDHRLVKSTLEQVSDVQATSKCMDIVHASQGRQVAGHYKNPMDSAEIFYNFIDEHYLDNHQFKLLAGENFKSRADSTEEQYIIVNEKLLQRFGIENPLMALGEQISIGDQSLEILGVVRDFNHATINTRIEPYAFRYNPTKYQYVNLVINSEDYIATLDKLEDAWSKIDGNHSFHAVFYEDYIEETYLVFSMLVKMVGFLAFLAISISAMGLLGMSVYAVETKLKEMSIRKIMGADTFRIVYILARGYVWLLLVSTLIAAPFTYWLVNFAILPKLAYLAPMSFGDVLGGLLIVFLIGLVMIGFQTVRAAQNNPVDTLRNE